MALLVRNELVLVKIEGTYGVDATPDGTDAMLVENVSFTPAGLRMVERAAIIRSLGMPPRVYGGALLEMRFDVELKGSGVAGTPPEIGPLLRACGLGETIVPATSVTYDPIDTGHESVTIYYYEEGRLMKGLGCRGDVSFRVEVGNLLRASFRMVGNWISSVDASAPSPTFDATVPPVAIGAAFEVGGSALNIAALEVAMNNRISTPPDINDAEGYADVSITGRDVGGSYDPELVLNSVRNFQADLRATTKRALTTGVIGTTPGNRVKIDLPATYVTNITPGDREGIRTYQLAFSAAESSLGAADEISIAFT